MSLLTDKTGAVLDQAMSLRFKRQQLLVGNVANIDTPNYRPVDLAFEGELKRALEETEGDFVAPSGFRQTDGMHMSAEIETQATPAEVKLRSDVTNSLDDNGVDLDQEMARLVDNSAKYQTVLEVTRRRFAMLTEILTTMGQG